MNPLYVEKNLGGRTGLETLSKCNWSFTWDANRTMCSWMIGLQTLNRCPVAVAGLLRFHACRWPIPSSVWTRRTVWLRLILLASCFVSMLASAPLWINSRLFPVLPITAWFPILPSLWDKFFFGAMLLSLVLAVWFYEPAVKVFLVASLFAFCEDQNRGQPWFYMYWVMLLLTPLPCADCAGWLPLVNVGRLRLERHPEMQARIFSMASRRGSSRRRRTGMCPPSAWMCCAGAVTARSARGKLESDLPCGQLDSDERLLWPRCWCMAARCCFSGRWAATTIGSSGRGMSR